jgi:pyruvate-formate lyase
MDMKSIKTPAATKFEAELRFTETYKKYKDAHPAIREAMCLKEQFPAFFTPIQEDDLFAGRIKNTLVGITPDEWGSTAFGYYCVYDKIEKELEDKTINEDLRQQVLKMVEFWKKESTSSKLRNAYTDEMKKYLPSDNWMGSSGIAFPLYRLTGGNVDWEKLLKKGIPGLIKDAEAFINNPVVKNKEYYTGTKMALELLASICLFYADQARELKENTDDEARKKELEKIASILEVITVSAPKNMREAVQLFWLYTYAGDIRNYGRMDVWLGDFYVNDIKTGSLTEEEALKLLQSLWRLIGARNTVVHSRVIIGGKGRRNEENADKFALLAMEATRTVFEIEPQLSLRFYKGQNPALMEKALQVIGEGRTYPILYNDDVNIESVKSTMHFDEKTAEQYVPYGCGEYIIEHQSFGTPSSVVNLLKALEVTLHNGIDPLTGKHGGIMPVGINELKTFDDLWNAYTRQVEHFVDLMAEQEVLEYKIAGEHAPYLYMSLLYDDCFEKGEGIFSGGIRYLGGTLETYGNTNTADSFTAIKKLVYEDKVYTLEEIIKALDSNFAGYDKLRQQLRNAPKYGNDHEEADDMLVKVHEHVCNYVSSRAEKVGLHSFLVVVINNSANTLMGHWTSASADGRLSGQPMANGNNPSGGNDKNGATAFLNSLLKPSPYIHAGAVQNMKFSREMFREKLDILKSLLDTYFENGGAQAMITVTDRNELERALEEPDKYSHIFVRVGGFSARFVELSRDVQLEILSRTLY